MTSSTGEYAAIPNRDGVPPDGDDGDDGDDAGNHQVDVVSKHSLTFTNGLALVVGLQIGSGIFAAPSQVSQHVPSSAWGVLAWLLAGLLVWTGAASFIELGLSIPRNGGIQEYLRASYGDFPAFLFAGMWVIVVKPCAMAMVAMVFSDNLCRSLFLSSSLSIFWIKLVALVGLSAVVLINCRGAKTGAVVANGFLILKLLAVFSVASLGLGYLVFGGPNVRVGTSSHHAQRGDVSSWSFIGNYVTAVFGVLFCYGGWETVGFVAGDMENPARDLPRVINTAMVVVIVGFTLMAVALYAVIPIEAMRETSTPMVDFGVALFGAFGGIIYSLTASACALGALHANIFATARLCVAAAQRSYFPSVLANQHLQPGQSESEYYESKSSWLLNPVRAPMLKFASMTADLRLRKGVPVYAILLSSCPAVIFILGGTFNGLVTFYGIVEYVFFFLSILGLYRIRKDPSLTSTYKTWTANPIIFCLLSGILVLRGVMTDPLQGAALALLILLGFVLFRYRFTSPGLVALRSMP